MPTVDDKKIYWIESKNFVGYNNIIGLRLDAKMIMFLVRTRVIYIERIWGLNGAVLLIFSPFLVYIVYAVIQLNLE